MSYHKRFKVELYKGDESPQLSNFGEIEYTKLFIDTEPINQDFQSFIPELKKPIPIEFTYDKCVVFKNNYNLNTEITISENGKKYYCSLSVKNRISLKYWFLIKWLRTTDALKWLIPLIISIISLTVSIYTYNYKSKSQELLQKPETQK